MKNTNSARVVLALKNLAFAFPEYSFYLFGSFVSLGHGDIIDVVIEADEKDFSLFMESCRIREVGVIFRKGDNNSLAMHWQEIKGETALRIFDVSKRMFAFITQGLPLEFFNFILLPRNWRDEKVIKVLRYFTDLYDSSFFENLKEEAKRAEDLTSLPI